MRSAATFLALIVVQVAHSSAPNDVREDLLWKKLDGRVGEIIERLDGVIGVAIVDLTDGRTISRNADRVFPTASSIKIAILLELYHQEQEARGGGQGQARLNDLYDFDPKMLVEFSQIMVGLTSGVTRVTNRDLAQFMVAVSDNTAANLLINRLGMDAINGTIKTLGLAHTALRRHLAHSGVVRHQDRAMEAGSLHHRDRVGLVLAQQHH